jgi:hypothetical protein
MAKRKPIKLHKGDVKKLAILCGVSTKQCIMLYTGEQTQKVKTK